MGLTKLFHSCLLHSDGVTLWTPLNNLSYSSQSHSFLCHKVNARSWRYLHKLTTAVKFTFMNLKWIKWLSSVSLKQPSIFFTSWYIFPAVLVCQEKRIGFCSSIFLPFLLFQSSKTARPSLSCCCFKQLIFSRFRKRKLKMFTVLLMCYTRWRLVTHCVAVRCRMYLLTAHRNSVSVH